MKVNNIYRVKRTSFYINKLKDKRFKIINLNLITKDKAKVIL